MQVMGDLFSDGELVPGKHPRSFPQEMVPTPLNYSRLKRVFRENNRFNENKTGVFSAFLMAAVVGTVQVVR